MYVYFNKLSKSQHRRKMLLLDFICIDWSTCLLRIFRNFVDLFIDYLWICVLRFKYTKVLDSVLAMFSGSFLGIFWQWPILIFSPQSCSPWNFLFQNFQNFKYFEYFVTTANLGKPFYFSFNLTVLKSIFFVINFCSFSCEKIFQTGKT